MTPRLEVRKLDDVTFEVTVHDGTTTTHTVTAPRDYAARLVREDIPVERLIIRSFEFLLEREPNTSILRRFELPVIARYFPEYERVIRGML